MIYVSHDVNSGPVGAKVSIYKSDCVEELSANEIVSVNAGPTLFQSHNITYGFLVDQSKLSTSEIVTFDDQTQTSGTISFCTKLRTQTSSGLDVGVKKLRLNVNFDLSNVAFTLENININEDAADIIAVDITFEVSACECTSDFKCIANPVPYSQGNTAPDFRVCITPDSPSTSISNLNLKLKSSTGYEYNPVTIGESGPVTDAITSKSESGSTTMITTKIIDGLFDGNSIEVSGLVYLKASQDARKENQELIEYDFHIQVESMPQDIDEESTRNCIQKLISRFF